ncbi:hypothetical protein BDV18DRAFT_134660 [Aspergillus unguis]
MESANSLPPQTQLCPSNANEIHFTPVKSSNVPRVWDRKPSTSFLARSKPRKVWKRFRSSFNSMKALQQLIAPDAIGLKESELLFEINTRRTTEYARGIKRQCVSAQRISEENDGTETSGGRGRSFLETKWEELSRKRRKVPATPCNLDEHIVVNGPQTEQDDEMAEIGDFSSGTTSNDNRTVDCTEDTGGSPMLTPESADIEAAYPDAQLGEADRLANEKRGVVVNIKSLDHFDQEGLDALDTTDAADGAAPTGDVLDVEAEAAAERQLQSDVATMATNVEQQGATTVPVELTAEQESTLVRSALRSSLDGDDTALLNNFLSKAKAKREAKAAAQAEAATVIASDNEDKEEQGPEQLQEEDLPTPQHQVFVEIPTPERRVLENLDTNSPSPQKSPSKASGKNEDSRDGSGSPVARRSTRVRSLQRAATPGGLRTTLSLRRARGNEFVFLQRTEAQELALQTRRNTKQNKGDSVLPKYTLQVLAKKTPDSSPVVDNGRKERNGPKKYVSWNEERLAEFEGEESDDELAQATTTTKTTTKPIEKKRAASSRSALSQTSLESGTNPAAIVTTAPSTAATRGRRVRRLGPPKPLEPSTNNSNDAESSPPSPTTTASPVARRRKLTPKSPKQTMTRPKTPSKLPTAAASNTGVPSLLSSGRSVKTNPLKVNAGSTPMPRRVRRA